MSATNRGKFLHPRLRGKTRSDDAENTSIIQALVSRVVVKDFSDGQPV